MATTLVRTRTRRPVIAQVGTQDEAAYWYAVQWLSAMDPHPLQNTAHRTQAGRLVTTLDELCRAVEDGEFIPGVGV